jgi:hypothetical protein
MGLILLYFYRPLTHETFFYRDLFVHFIPARRLLAEYIRARHLPLWNPYMLGGGPFLSDPTNLVLYPTSLLYFVIPWVWAFNGEIVLHFAWAGAGAYLLARALGYHPRASFLAGVIYTFCGYTLVVTPWGADNTGTTRVHPESRHGLLELRLLRVHALNHYRTR